MEDPTLLGVPAVLFVILLVQGAKRLGVKNGQTPWVALAISLGVAFCMRLAQDILLTENFVKPLITSLLIWLAAIGLYQFRPNGHGNAPLEEKKP